MNDLDAVSVVICTYNGEEYLAAQLESILAQTYRLHEIIICDDASADNSLNIAETFAAIDNRIKVFKNEKKLGFVKNFEQAIICATGNLIAISDQDDIWLPKKIETLIGCWPKGSPLVYCDSMRFENDIPTVAKENHLYRRFYGKNVSQLFLFNTVSGHALMFRRSLIEKILPFNEGLYYDWCMAAIAACNGGVTYCPQTLVFQRVHQQNISIEKKNLTVGQVLKLKKKEAAEHLGFFAAIENMPEKYMQLAKKLKYYLSTKNSVANRIMFFNLLMVNRVTLFNVKKRKFGLPSHFKLAFKWAFL